MVLEKNDALPNTLEEFKDWDVSDGFKYEWNDGELIQFEGMKKSEFYIYLNLLRFFTEKNLIQSGGLVAEQDVELSAIQMRRPDISYFSNEQAVKMKSGSDEIPEFAIEIISKNDNLNKVEEKIEEYFKYGVKVIWLILPELKKVKVYNNLHENKNCYSTDICSASPVLPTFELSVNQIFA